MCDPCKCGLTLVDEGGDHEGGDARGLDLPEHALHPQQVRRRLLRIQHLSGRGRGGDIIIIFGSSPITFTAGTGERTLTVDTRKSTTSGLRSLGERPSSHSCTTPPASGSPPVTSVRSVPHGSSLQGA
jgi:hypothetical protein